MQCVRSNKNIKRLAILLTLVIINGIFSTLTFASDFAVIEGTDGTKQFATIEGTTTNSYENVSIQVLKPNAVITADMSRQEYKSASIFDITVTSDIEKKFLTTFEFPNNSATGKYTVNIKADGGEKQTLYINLVSLSELNNQLEIIKTSDSEAYVKKAISEYYDKLGIHINNPSLITSDSVKLFIKNRNAEKQTDFTVSEISSLIEEAFSIYEIQTSTIDTISAQLLKYDSFLSLSDGNAYKYYKPSVDEINKTNSNLLAYSGSEYSTFNQLQSEYQAQLLRTVTDRSWYSAKEVLTKFEDELMAELDDYKKLSETQKDSVSKEVFNSKGKYSKSTFQAVLDLAVSNAKNVTSGQGSDGRGGIGGGGGGGGTVTIAQTPAPVQTQQPSVPSQNSLFKDVEEEAPWAVEAVNKLCSVHGIISENPEMKFRPNDKVTREEFVKMVVLMVGLEVSYENTEFSDVKGDEWYAAVISTAHRNGIISGIDDNSFGIGQSIIRQDMAVMIYRALYLSGFSGEKGVMNFSDKDDIEPYAAEAVEYLSNNKIVNGSNGYFYPKNYSTRAEAAQIIYNALYRQ